MHFLKNYMDYYMGEHIEEGQIKLKASVDNLVILYFAYLGDSLCPVFYSKFSEDIMEVSFYGIDSQVSSR